MTPALLIILAGLFHPVQEDTAFVYNLYGFTRNADVHADSALFYAKGMLAAAHESGDETGIVRAEYAIGYAYRALNQYTDAIQHYRNSWQVARSIGLEQRELMASNGLGMSLYLTGNYPEALRYLYMSLLVRERRNDPLELATIYNNIGLVYMKLWNWQKAHEYFTLATLQFKAPDRPDEETLVNLATCLVYMRRFEEAHQRFAEFEKTCGKDCSPGLLCDFYNAKGGMYLNQEDLESARIYFQKALKLAYHHSLEADQEIAYDNLSNLEMRNENYAVARMYADSALQVALTLGIPHRIESNYRQLAELENFLNHPENSVKFWFRYDSMRRQVKGLEVMNEIYSSELEWIENGFTSELARQEEQISSTQKTNVIIGIMAGFLTVVAFLWWYNYRKKKIALENLENAQRQLVRQEKMAALGSLMAGIAHELNNPLSAAIGSLNSGIDRLKMLIEERKNNSGYSEVVGLMQANASPGRGMLTGMERRRVRKELIEKIPGNAEPAETAEQLIDLGVDKITPELEKMLGSSEARHAKQLINAFLLQREIERTDDALRNMQMVIQSLRESARGNKGEYLFTAVDLESSIGGVLVLLHNQLKHGIHLDIQLKPGEIFVKANPQRLTQVWLNLFVNSLQSMQQNGRLSVRVDHRWKNFIKIEVVDSGQGILPEDQPYIFDKFYTTRHSQDGSGLGLNIVKDIVDEHGGEISFTSGEFGTSMVVFLPRA